MEWIKMETLLHDVQAALLAGLTHKTGNEIHWKDKNGNPFTVEITNIKEGKYIIRHYYPGGNKNSKIQCQNGQLCGKDVGWHKNGNKKWEGEHRICTSCEYGQRHGKLTGWYESGNKWWETEYLDGLQHGKSILWHENGNKKWEEEYQNGELIKKIL